MLQIITTKEELQDTIDRAIQKALGQPPQSPLKELEPTQTEYVKGIAGLAKILKCSNPTAQKLKNSGKVPFYQDGRTLLFRTDEVLKAIQSIPRKTA
jgi:excisionase family DNA binding protein